jgi:hypothetical protein
MPRRFALLLIALLVSLTGALFLARYVRGKGPRRDGVISVPTPAPTPVVPPTPIPARRVVLYFESVDDGRLHPEARDLPVMADDIALLRAVGAAVLDGPRTPGLLSPFPEGWRLRAAYRLTEGLAVLDLDPPRDKNGERSPGAPPVRWETGSREELMAAQAVIVSAVKNTAGLTRFILLIGGEPVETLGGHLDLSHPLSPDLTNVSDDPPAAAPPPSAVPSPASALPPAPIPASSATAPLPRPTPPPTAAGRGRADAV